MRWAIPLALVVAMVASGSTATGATVAVIDRTFACNPSYDVAHLTVSPRGTPQTGGTVSSGYARLTSGAGGDPLADLVAFARPGPRNPGTRFPAAVYASVRRCAEIRAPIPLSRAGLPGPPVAFPSVAECMVRRKMIARVRAVLATPAPWRRLGGQFRRTYVGVAGRVVSAELALRDQRTGKPLAFVTMNSSGQTKLWSSFQCS